MGSKHRICVAPWEASLFVTDFAALPRDRGEKSALRLPSRPAKKLIRIRSLFLLRKVTLLKIRPKLNPSVSLNVGQAIPPSLPSSLVAMATPIEYRGRAPFEEHLGDDPRSEDRRRESWLDEERTDLDQAREATLQNTRLMSPRMARMLV